MNDIGLSSAVPAAGLGSRNWRIETLLRLFVLLFFAFSLGGMLISVVAAIYARRGATMPAALNVVVGTVTLHGIAIPALLWFVRENDRSVSGAFGLRTGSRRRAILTGIGAAVVALPVIYGLQALSVVVLKAIGMKPDAQENVKLLLEGGFALRAYIAVFAVVVAPMVEEALFRGVLLTFFRDLGHCRAGVWFTAVLFGLVHFNRAAFVPLAVFGLLLAWLYERTGNLLAPLAAHATFNLAPFVMLALGIHFDFAT